MGHKHTEVKGNACKGWFIRHGIDEKTAIYEYIYNSIISNSELITV